MNQHDHVPISDLNMELTALFEQREKLSENDFMDSIFAFCFKLPSGLRVIFDLEIPRETEDGLVEELRSRLEKVSILSPDQETCQLIIQSPLVSSGAISAADTLRYNRYPFNIIGFKGKKLLEVNPTGMPFIAQPYYLPATVINNITVSSNKTLYLSPGLSPLDGAIVIPEWQLPEHLVE